VGVFVALSSASRSEAQVSPRPVAPPTQLICIRSCSITRDHCGRLVSLTPWAPGGRCDCDARHRAAIAGACGPAFTPPPRLDVRAQVQMRRLRRACPRRRWPHSHAAVVRADLHRRDGVSTAETHAAGRKRGALVTDPAPGHARPPCTIPPGQTRPERRKSRPTKQPIRNGDRAARKRRGPCQHNWSSARGRTSDLSADMPRRPRLPDGTLV
jgi:hypothetical protein